MQTLYLVAERNVIETTPLKPRDGVYRLEKMSDLDIDVIKDVLNARV